MSRKSKRIAKLLPKKINQAFNQKFAAIALLSSPERLAGRPRLCSNCGLCASSYKSHMAQSCMFVQAQTTKIEQNLHGRNRHNEDEFHFGIFRTQHATRLKLPNPNAQWSGIVTALGARLLASGRVEAVLTTGAAAGTRFQAQPVLARTPDEVLATAGNKPSLSPILNLLDEIKKQAIQKLAVIGTGCQIHALRALQPGLNLQKLYTIGIPCSDNVTYSNLQYFLNNISRSPQTVVHYEFMQDFRLWLRHQDKTIERVNYIDFPMNRLLKIFPAACLACFDYPNALSDLTVGYMGAPLGWQWVLIRTELGEELWDLLDPDIEYGTLIQSGDRTRGMPQYLQRLTQSPSANRPPWLIRRLIAWLQRNRGPRGLEFARAIIEMKFARNLNFIRGQFARRENQLVPAHVYSALNSYSEIYYKIFEQSLINN